MTARSRLTAEVDQLAGRLRGAVLRPGDQGYDQERAGFQRALEQRPAVVVAAEGAEDVRLAVELAAAQGLPLAVQATGHGLVVPCDGGVLVSTRRMTAVRVDPGTGTARVAAGATSGQVVEAAAPYGLAPLSGSAPGVGAVSYTLGGGLGLLGRSYGWAADHVRTVQAVGADARLRDVTADSDPELFWALRGGRDNFGLATEIEVELFPVPDLYGGGLYFGAGHAAAVLETWRAWTATVPEAMNSSVGLVPYPDLPAIPEPLRGRWVAHLRVAYLGEEADGERLVAPLRAAGPALLDHLGRLPYRRSGSIHNDPTQPHGYVGTNVLVRELDPSLPATILDLVGQDAPVPCVVEVRHLGGALARPPAVPNAVGHRDAAAIVRVLSPAGAGDLDAVRTVHQRFFDAIRPLTVGRSLNFIYGHNGTAEQVREAFEPDDHRRLAELKAAVDPGDLFRCNHHIPPARP